MKIAIIGINGKMGKELANILKEKIMIFLELQKRIILKFTKKQIF
jgi:dihydrodipicolinate reductase